VRISSWILLYAGIPFVFLASILCSLDVSPNRATCITKPNERDGRKVQPVVAVIQFYELVVSKRKPPPT
jgi:hypothetical protein